MCVGEARDELKRMPQELRDQEKEKEPLKNHDWYCALVQVNTVKASTGRLSSRIAYYLQLEEIFQSI